LIISPSISLLHTYILYIKTKTLLRHDRVKVNFPTKKTSTEIYRQRSC